MDASNFFSKLLKQPKSSAPLVEVDDIGEFDKAWRAIQVGFLIMSRGGLIIRIHLNTLMRGSFSSELTATTGVKGSDELTMKGYTIYRSPETPHPYC
jgi:hypothetical protein